MSKLLVFVLTLLAATVAMVGQSSAHAPAVASSNRTVHQVAEHSSPSMKTTAITAPIEEAESENERREKRENERWMMYATVALAVITLALAVFTALLWWWTKKLAGDAKETAERQAKEMQESLAIARKSTEITQSLERALVYAQPSNNMFADDTKKRVIGKIITAANYGKTPALVQKVVWGMCDFKEGISIPEPTKGIETTKILYPGAEPIWLLPVQFDLQPEGALFFGRVYYSDVFGERFYTTWVYRIANVVNGIDSDNAWPAWPVEHNAELHRCT